MKTYFTSEPKNEIVLNFNPLCEYEFVEDGFVLASSNGVESDISHSLILPAFDHNGEVVSKAYLKLDKAIEYEPIYFNGAYSFSSNGETTTTVWCTYDLSCFMALDNAGVQCAYIFPSVLRSIQEPFKGIESAINNIAKTGFFNDIRVIANYPDVEKVNDYLKKTQASVYWLIEPMIAQFEPDYVFELLERATDATKRTEFESEFYDAWAFKPIFDKPKSLQSGLSSAETRYKAAHYALSLAVSMQARCPAFYSISDIEHAIAHPLLHEKTTDSIMRRVAFMIEQRKKLALSAVKAKNWRNHDYIKTDSLENLDIKTDVVLVTAPTGAGKTKNIITPFCNEAKKQDKAFLTIAPLRTLIHELAAKLKVSHYEKVKTRAQAETCNSMAVCLPSIKSLGLKPFIDRAAYIAIDEISQNLRYTAVGKINVRGTDHEGVYMQLKELVADSRKVIAADASIDDMTLDFFESARPGEKFTIIEQLPKYTGRQCHIYEEMGDLIGEIIRELKFGGNVWICVESADRAMALDRFFHTFIDREYSSMLVCGENSDDDIRKNFIANIQEESKKYRIVIASPSISSGVSVEHDIPHFTMIAGIASGQSIAPTDFMQMLARVRYVSDYHVCILANNEKNNHITVNSIVEGQKKAASLEGQEFKMNDFTEFKAAVIVNNGKYRADFANGFYWIMEYYQFDIVRHGDSFQYDFLSKKVSESSKEIKEAKEKMLMSAEPFNHVDEALALENKQDKSQEDRIRIEAHKMRMILALSLDHVLTAEDIEMAQNSRRLMRFLRFNSVVPKSDDSEKNIALRRFDNAQVKAYETLFDRFDLKTERWTEENAQIVIDRIIADRFLYYSLGLVPKKYGAWVENKKTKILLPFSKPAYPVRELNSIIEMMGLATKKREGSDGHFYQVTEPSFKKMMYYCNKRIEHNEKTALN